MKSKWILMTALAAALSMAVSGMAQVPATKAPEAAKSTAHKKTADATPAPTAQEISDAKTQGLVWVNTSTKVYHKEGPSYGTTKKGKFMTEEDAKKAGYKAAKVPAAKHAKTGGPK
jgi:hypothetical protein